VDNITLIASEKNWIDTRSVDALKNVAKLEGVKRVVGLPDLSVGNVPNGMAVITQDYIYPHLIGGDIGCGMMLCEVKIKPKKIKVEKFAKYLSKIESLDDIDIDMPHLGFHLGSIGKGNHFAELHLVDSIKDKELFESLNLSANSLYTLVHSGSRAFGQIVFDRFVDKYEVTKGINTKDASSYLQEHNQALQYAKTSRMYITQKLLKVIKIDTKANLVSDTFHNAITKIDGGWLHQKGATPTNKGAVIIAGSRGSLSYLVMPTEDTSYSNYSLAHGAGRKWERSVAKAKLKARYTKSDMQKTVIGSRVVCSDSNLLYEEAFEAYKDIDTVIADLLSAKLIKVIATFKPILTYKE